MPRYLAIDHGTARVGLAISDDLGFLAHPLETVPTAQALDRLAAVVAQRQITHVVLGLPIRTDGTEGDAAARVRKFHAQLAHRLGPAIPITLQDESHTTVAAHAQLRAAGHKTHRHKPMIDQAAAVIILQEFLDRQNPQNFLVPFPEDEPEA